MPLLPASLIEPVWVEFSALIESDRPEFDPTHPWRMRALDRPAPSGLDRRWDTLDRDLGFEAQSVEQVAGLARVVAAVQVHGREQVLIVHAAVLGQRADHVADSG